MFIHFVLPIFPQFNQTLLEPNVSCGEYRFDVRAVPGLFVVFGTAVFFQLYTIIFASCALARKGLNENFRKVIIRRQFAFILIFTITTAI